MNHFDEPQTIDVEEKPAIWKRGLFMIAIAILFAISETLLFALAVVQFFWALFTGQPNDMLREFGASLGNWMRQAARYQSFESDERPFPWADWPGADRR